MGNNITIKDILIFSIVVLLGLTVIIGGIWGLISAHKVYRIWSAEQDGKAKLAYAEVERQVQVADAKAKIEAAKYQKQILVEQAKAEVEAAKLRAEAIAIVGEMAKKYPEYREQEFIGAFAESLKEGKISQIFYVPTENNIPIVRNIK